MFVLGDNFFIRQLVNYSQVVNLPNLKNINFYCCPIKIGFD